jgi:hypothetical protein
MAAEGAGRPVDAAAGSREACARAWVSTSTRAGVIFDASESTTSCPLMPYLAASALTCGPYSRTIVMSGRNLDSSLVPRSKRPAGAADVF